MIKDSIVRDGNHFIRLEKAGWVLIDGPWFKTLSGTGQRYIKVPVYKPLKLECLFDDNCDMLEFFEFETMYWEAIRWNPGYALFQDARRVCTFSNKDLWRRWWAMLQKRTQVGWRVLPDGRLPILFNAMEWHSEMEFL